MPNDTRFAQEWGLHNTGQTGGTADADIDAPEAWNIVTGSPSVVVAVIDTGVDYNHPDLTANMWTNPGETAGNGVDDDHNGYVDDVRGWDFYGEQNDPKDDHFHGTHVAGTIGAAGNNGRGVVGVNWQVKIMALKFLSAGGYGYTSDAVNAIHYATIKGARIMSCSWGGGGYSQSLKNMIDAAASAGVLMAAAAGNSSSDNDQYPMYPASYSCSNIIAVAATDSRDQLAWFSNYGATSVHLAAPGVGVLSTLPTVKTPAMTDYGLPTDYGSLSGTSMATPHVSGAAALALAQDPGLTLAQLRARIVQRTDHLSNLAGVVQSGGRLNAFNAVDPGGDEDPPPGPVKAAMLSPTNGTTFTSASVTFIWDAGVGVSKYALWVGSALRTYDIAGWV
ncbi:MAG: peptidase S8, partial [Verrucomicrobia bacterium]|nr:peptidase S8 [Verrucomicrobiota bacterium]